MRKLFLVLLPFLAGCLGYQRIELGPLPPGIFREVPAEPQYWVRRNVVLFVNPNPYVELECLVFHGSHSQWSDVLASGYEGELALAPRPLIGFSVERPDRGADEGTWVPGVTAIQGPSPGQDYTRLCVHNKTTLIRGGTIDVTLSTFQVRYQPLSDFFVRPARYLRGVQRQDFANHVEYVYGRVDGLVSLDFRFVADVNNIVSDAVRMLRR